MFVVTEEWIEKNRTKAGGWNKIQLEQLGVSWPAKSGWKKAAVGLKISDDERTIFEAHGAGPVAQKAPDAPQVTLMDIDAFDDLIDAYQDAQRNGNSQERADARRALKNAYRAALRAAGKEDV